MSNSIHAGDTRIDRIVEFEGPFMPAADMLKGLTPELLEENRHWLEPDALAEGDVLRLAMQTFVVRTPHHTVLIDTCIGNHKDVSRIPAWNDKTDTRYMDGLAALGLGVDAIDYVMCTHLHVDHVGWNTTKRDGRWVPTFPNARYVFAQTEYDYWQQENAKSANPVFNESVLPIVEAGRAELVGMDHGIGDHFRLLPTPGHTPGHVSIAIGAGGDDAVVSGDIMHSPLQTRYPEISASFDNDPALSAVSRRSFLERFAETPTICCMTHFPSPSMGRIKRWGEGFRCENLPA